MSSGINVLACDIGGGSGRILNVEYRPDRLDLSQVTRFRNGPIKVGQNLYWDILGIFRDIKEGLVKASCQGLKAVSLGIDTWGNDFVLLDKKGYVLENPHSYRDSRTEDIVRYVGSLIPDFELYSHNGIQQVRMNTMYQLVSLVRDRSYVFENAHRFLFIPDLLTYFLTGEIYNEYTLATISQLYNYGKQDWDRALMERLGIPAGLFPSIIQPGARCGSILPSVCSDLYIESLPLITVGAHDTASAVVAVPEPEEHTVYISSGTWSILGTETCKPVINETAFKYNFSNEGGVGGKIRLLKNVMGMWIVQEVQRCFANEGRKYTFEDLYLLAQAAEPFGPVIDPDDNCFYEPADMPEVIRKYCMKTGQRIPASDGEIVRTALESLAFKYRYVVEKLENLTGHSYSGIHIVGGGAQNKLLCQMTSDCCGCTVYAGPVEATALGNALTQLISLGELSGLRDARSLIKKCFPPMEFYPRDGEVWEEQYQAFLALTNLQ